MSNFINDVINADAILDEIEDVYKRQAPFNIARPIVVYKV